jgi:hypothetical protein
MSLTTYILGALVTPAHVAMKPDFPVYGEIIRRALMTVQALESAIPDLRAVPVDRLAELGGAVLANSIDLYRQRLQESSLPLNAFSSSI